MNIQESKTHYELAKSMGELSCELARTCNEKENYFAAMFNLTPAEFKCLRLFSEKTYLSIKELSLELNLTPGRITHILTSLEDKSFVIRKVDPTDKRNVIVHLTPKSEPFIKNINEKHIQIHEDILNRIDADKREIVLLAMKDVIRALKSWTNEVK